MWDRSYRKGLLLLALSVEGLILLFSLAFDLPVSLLLYELLLVGLLFLAFAVLGHRQLLEDQRDFLERPISRELVTLQERAQRALDEERELRLALEEERRQEEDYLLLWSHEIKTPIAALRLGLTSRTLHREELLPEVFRIEGYVEQLLMVLRQEFRQEDFLFRPLPAKAFCQERVRRLRHLFLAKGLSVSLDAVDVPMISDSRWFGYVVDQVLLNAIKYTDEGTISLSWDGRALTITDTGIGIPKKDLPRVFDRGFSGENGRRFGQGTGIGLSLAKEILTRLGGEISIASTQGVGTTVVLALPSDKDVR